MNNKNLVEIKTNLKFIQRTFSHQIISKKYFIFSVTGGNTMYPKNGSSNDIKSMPNFFKK